MKRLPPSPFAPTMIAVLMMCATLLFSLNASAQNRGYDVQLNTLSVERDRGQLIITYQVDARDWGALQQARIQPRLNVYLPDGSSRDFEFVQALRIDAPRGQATMRLGSRAAASHAELRLVGTQGPNTITTMRLERRRPAQTLRLPIVELRRSPGYPDHDDRDRDDRYDRDRDDRYDRDRYGRRHDRDDRYGRDRDDHDDRDDRYDRRRDRDHRRPPHAGRPHRPGPPPHAGHPHHPRPGASRAQIVEACGDQSPFPGQVTHCIESATRLPAADAVATIRACGDATTFSGDFEHCMNTASAFRTPPAPAIRACGEATSFSSDFRGCVSAAAGFRHRPAPVIRACSEATSFSRDFQQCLDASRA
ncbi:hypothetical protein FRC98_14920 [Lujinxingia vulgaris]|uniref:Uncharacterized protein n=1 Tax=Lujinxingia vulgaris TaxID=2600176 RepID=A0A5C6XCY0_9DELT|nr:hypothetical protein [Lujinxingia vulgaris]TXD35961.1 hypothetical protein FRC98_14920 [Lujinxingia vulgaris]